MRRSSLLSWLFTVLLCTSFAAGITTGDFNGDGRLDYVLLTQCSPTPCSNSTISVSFGKGDGHFREPVTTTTEGFPMGDELVGDFNGDHKLDLAFLSWDPTGPALAVVLGNGAGRFGSTMLYSLSPGSHRLLGGDVNHDGKFDLIITREMPGVFLGNGDGTFQLLAGAPGVEGCALADVNHDGHLDAIGNSVSLGNGDGTFQSSQDITGLYSCPAIADFNGDGNLDIVTVIRGGINMYFGVGDGTFLPPVFKWLFSGEPPMVVSGDFNGDGWPDLLVNRGDHMSVVLNGRSAKFRSAVGYLSASSVVGDFNGDGRSDLLILGRGRPVTAALAASDGTFPLLPRAYWLESSYGASMLAGDLNGDGKLDLIAVSSVMLTWDGGEVNRLIRNGDGTFKVQQSLQLTGGTHSLLAGAADLNNDGKLDIVTTSSDSLNVLLGLGNGLFQTPQIYPLRGSSQVAIADFNGDGVLDLALNTVMFTVSNRAGMILLGNGDGTFRNGVILPAQYDRLVAGDFNNDGRQDLAAAVSGKVGIMLGNGDGTFQTISVLRVGYAGSLQAVDLNSDGNLDLVGVGANASGGAIASVYLGSGTAILGPATNIWIKGLAYSPTGAVTGDFNQDGKPDLAVSLGYGETAILFGNGTGAFASKKFYLGGGGQIVAGDFDGNGTEDLAALTWFGHTVVVPLKLE